jgi:protein MpaA
MPEKAYCLTGPNGDETVDINRSCESIANRLASVSNNACIAAKLEDTGCHSMGGFPILVREFPPLEGKQAQGRILVIGGTHGDELTSVSVVFRWIAKLNKFHSGLFHWHVAPMMNPDGVLNRAASRTNKNGVDLNRNMPSDDWLTKALSYWENQGGQDPRKYPGESAASEPETQWLIDEINAFQPDAIISVHAPYGVVDFDSLLLNTAPKSLGKLHLNLLGTYPGSLGNYAGMNRNIPVITLELPHAWEMPSQKESTQIWDDIVSWLRENIDNRTTATSPEVE